MAKVKCGYCQKKQGKRYCEPLDTTICPQCCGTNRIKKISCKESCRYLENDTYQQKVRKDKKLRELIKHVPHSEHDDIFNNPEVAEIAFSLESFFLNSYLSGKYKLTDQHVKSALSDLYFKKFEGEILELDNFALELELVCEINSEKYDGNLVRSLVLRLIISINKMSGGSLGACGYLNYLKNNLANSDMLGNGEFIIENKGGNISKHQVDL